MTALTTITKTGGFDDDGGGIGLRKRQSWMPAAAELNAGTVGLDGRGFGTMDDGAKLGFLPEVDLPAPDMIPSAGDSHGEDLEEGLRGSLPSICLIIFTIQKP